MKLLLSRLSKDHWPIFLIGNISAAINLILPLVLVRLFTPESMGIYKIFFLYLGLIPFLTMAGGPLHSVYYWIGKKNHNAEFIQSTWIATNFLSIVFVIPLVLISYLFRSHLPLEFYQILILIFCSVLVCPSAHYAEVCMAKGQTIKSSMISLSFELIKTIGFIFIAWKHKNIDYLFSYYLIIMSLSFIVMNTLAYYDKVISFNIDYAKVKDVFKYSLPISFSSGLLFIIEKSDQLILSIFLSAENFAFFSMGSLLIPPLYLLESAIQKKLIPNLAKEYEEHNYTAMAKSVSKAIEDMGFLIIPSIFGLIFFAYPIIKILYTDQYREAAIYLQIFSLSYFFLLIPHDSILRASGKTKMILKTYTIFTPISILLLLLTAKYTNALTTLAVALVLKFMPKLYCFSICAKVINQEIRSMIPFKKLFYYSALSLILSLISMALKPLFLEEIFWFLVCGSAFALIYLAVFISLKEKHTRV